MLKPISKLLSFIVILINVTFYYLWIGVHYVSTVISTFLMKLPLISIVGSIIGFIGDLLSRLIILLWYVFDYIIVFLKELLMPVLLAVFGFLKRVFLWIWKMILFVIRLFIPECRADKEYCLKFDKKRSYGIALALDEEFEEQNRLYETTIHKHFQKQLDEVYKQEKEELAKRLKKATQGKKNADMKSYNDLLVKVQTQESNILNNYYLSIDQHRLILTRQRDTVSSNVYKKLHTNALHKAAIFQEALI